MENFALIKESNETVSLVENFHTWDINEVVKSIDHTRKVLLTGEGSSRIFPAKNLIASYFKLANRDLEIVTLWCREALRKNFDGYTVIWASNSGRTKEVVDLFKAVDWQKYCITAHSDTVLWKESHKEYVLSCGSEQAVAATKSVIEQWLFYQNALHQYLYGKPIDQDVLSELSSKIDESLHIDIPEWLIEKLASSTAIYFSWSNNGVAEEATLKTNEIVRKKSGYFEWTYAVHGVEEVLEDKDVVVVIQPYPEEQEKFREVLEHWVWLTVIAISHENTIFPTIIVPQMEWYQWYIDLATCRNLLIKTWLKLDINIDEPERARKVWNEV